jgi:hypothetical protein
MKPLYSAPRAADAFARHQSKPKLLPFIIMSVMLSINVLAGAYIIRDHLTGSYYELVEHDDWGKGPSKVVDYNLTADDCKALSSHLEQRSAETSYECVLSQ